MEFFINELSLNGQFESHHDFKIATNQFIDLIEAIDELNLQNKATLFGTFFFGYTPLQNTRFDTALKQDRELNTRFTLNLQKLNPKAWESNRLHQSSISYTFEQTNCTDTAAAEVAERKVVVAGYSGILMNFTKSIFSDNRSINIIKANNTANPIITFCSYDRDSLYEWLTSIGIILPGARTFEHHKKKHDRAKPTPGNAILLCTEAEAQVLLDGAIKLGNSSGRLYNFDTTFQKFIVFNLHLPNTYHGYHVDDPNEIPEQIRNEF